MMKPQIPENKWVQGKPDSIENSKGLWGGRLFTFARLSSTNVWTKKNLRFFRNGDIIITRHQTEGRGRFSRSWFSPGLKCLTLSVVLSETHIPENPSQTGQLAALAIRKILESYDISAWLKWPNDVYVNGKKISGILSEFDNREKKVILGIGLNINVKENDLFLAGLKDATSMMVEKHQSFPLEAMQKDLLLNLEIYIGQSQKKGMQQAMTEWSKHDWLTGCMIEIVREKNKTIGLYKGLDEEGRICLRTPSDKNCVFSDGHVRKIKSIE